MSEFLHGVETIRLQAGPRPIQQVRTAIIGLVGTAPAHHTTDGAELNKPTLVLSDRDNVKFGPDLDGYTIPKALKAIQDQGAGLVVVINVFDPTTHQEAVAAADRAIVDGVVTLPHADVLSVVVKEAGGAGAALVEGTDYEFDGVKGTVTVKAGGALVGDAQANIAYVRAMPSEVTEAQVIGTVDVNGNRTGAQALLDVNAIFGFKPKILIAPGYSSDATVRAALGVLAQELKLRAVVLADVPVATPFDDVLEGRSPAGAVDLVVADERVFLCYPHFKVGDELEPFSQRFAGVIARTDADRGYWHSPSNKDVLGVEGIEFPLTAAINDPLCEVNQLNAQGIVTAFTGNGVGVRAWGNRSSAFPGSADVETFMSVLRTLDVVDESVELATLAHLDGPVGSVLIEAVLADVNAFIRTLITRGALLPGSRVEYFAEDNPPAELAAGKVTFTKTYMPPPPAERITYKSIVDTTLLSF